MKNVFSTITAISSATLVYAFVTFTPTFASENYHNNDHHDQKYSQNSKHNYHNYKEPTQRDWDNLYSCGSWEKMVKSHGHSYDNDGWKDYNSWKKYYPNFSHQDYEKWMKWYEKNHNGHNYGQNYNQGKHDWDKNDWDRNNNGNNRVSYYRSNRTTINQSNNANISNNVSSYSNTGNNSASRNTRGEVSIHTGSTHSSVSITNNANSNVIH